MKERDLTTEVGVFESQFPRVNPGRPVCVGIQAAVFKFRVNEDNAAILKLKS